MKLASELGSWYEPLRNRVDLDKLVKAISLEYHNKQVYPKPENIFRIFKLLAPRDIRVIILGQSPYHDGTATGISFASESDNIPPTLKIIKAEVENTVYPLEPREFDYTLMKWVNQGVFMYNTSLTVVQGIPNSHENIWMDFTKGVMEILNEMPGLIWCLWGNEAKKTKKYINPTFHHILEAAHPSAECYKKAAGFYDCDHFNLINEIIIGQNGREFEIKW